MIKKKNLQGHSARNLWTEESNQHHLALEATSGYSYPDAARKMCENEIKHYKFHMACKMLCNVILIISSSSLSPSSILIHSCLSGTFFFFLRINSLYNNKCSHHATNGALIKITNANLLFFKFEEKPFYSPLYFHPFWQLTYKKGL